MVIKRIYHSAEGYPEITECSPCRRELGRSSKADIVMEEEEKREGFYSHGFKGLCANHAEVYGSDESGNLKNGGKVKLNEVKSWW